MKPKKPRRPIGTAAVRRKPRYTLAELIAQCDLTAPPTADLIAWQNLRPVGKEIL